MDWDKYNPSIVYSGGVDHAIKAWDLRRPQAPLSIMHGHGCVLFTLCRACIDWSTSLTTTQHEI